MKYLAPALLVLSMALVGCNRDSKTTTTTTTHKASMGMVNTTCPYSGKKLDASSPTVNYKGQEVGFCCDGCAGKFNKLSDQEKAAKISAAK